MAWLSLLVAIALIWWLMKLGRGALFEIRLAPGKLVVKRGKVSPAFIEHAKQILRHETVRGRILGQRDGDGVSWSSPAPSPSRWPSVFATSSPMPITASRRRPCRGQNRARVDAALAHNKRASTGGPFFYGRGGAAQAYSCSARWALTVAGLMATPSLPQEARNVLTSPATCSSLRVQP